MSQQDIAVGSWQDWPEICHCHLAGSSDLGSSVQIQVLDSKLRVFCQPRVPCRMGNDHEEAQIHTKRVHWKMRPQFPPNRRRQGLSPEWLSVGCLCEPLLLCKERSWIKIRSKRAGQPWAAAAAELCPTLCDPTDGSPPGSPIPGILQARTLEWDFPGKSTGVGCQFLLPALG